MTSDRPSNEVGGLKPVYGSDLVADLLRDLEIEFVACNPGASFRGLHDSLINYVEDGPELIECLHEEIAVAVAHGYAKARGKPMAVALHDVVGLQHAAMAIYNIWCDRIPVLLIGATGPMDASKRRPWIDWIHTANVQANQVRDYTKWDDQPSSIAAVPESLIRALQLARAKPAGPVYVCLDVDVQEEEVPANLQVPDIHRFADPGPIAPDPAAVRTLAEWLVGADRPVIIADEVGRDQESLEALIDLAELLAIPVIDREFEYNKFSLNFPTRHPLNLSGREQAIVGEADLVIGLECRDLFGALNGVDEATSRVLPLTTATSKVANVSMAHFVTRSWATDFQRLQPADLFIAAEVSPTLNGLLAEVRRLAPVAADHRDRVETRRTRLTEISDRARTDWAAEAEGLSTHSPIHPAYLALRLGELTAEFDRVLANGHLGNWVHRLWDLNRTDQYLGNAGGGGLGYGLGAGIGAALAHRGAGRLIINIQSDGDALFTPGALWTAAHYKLPQLIVMDNNRQYANSVKHAGRIARRRRRPVEKRWVGTVIDEPAIDFATMARSFGVHGEGPITRPDELDAALGSALSIVLSEGRPALVDVVTEALQT